MVLAILNGLTTVCLVGNKIDTGIEGWIKIAKRIKNIFSKSDRSYFDLDIAKVLGIEFLSKEINIDSVKVVMQSDITVKDLSGMLTDRTSDEFIAKPYSLYLITFEINENLLITLGIRSDGIIKEHYRFDKNDFLPF